jgi:ribosomal protein S18 acetylase RimI-like enzyme
LALKVLSEARSRGAGDILVEEVENYVGTHRYGELFISLVMGCDNLFIVLNYKIIG